MNTNENRDQTNYDGTLTKLADRRRFVAGRSFEHELLPGTNLSSPPLGSLRRPAGCSQMLQKAIVKKGPRTYENTMSIIALKLQFQQKLSNAFKVVAYYVANICTHWDNSPAARLSYAVPGSVRNKRLRRLAKSTT
jgi:hypothetical protein